ncbi:predicted protein [Botrytis cinerea T4]|uniref:Uncharacterized protein n=1 Tax=Botryotinia fuckeliana (strain T4) TaxID=999810 RepID=G2YV11_BOTF4|nr:predicted protein [Botrytis cinerea T4]
MAANWYQTIGNPYIVYLDASRVLSTPEFCDTSNFCSPCYDNMQA